MKKFIFFFLVVAFSAAASAHSGKKFFWVDYHPEDIHYGENSPGLCSIIEYPGEYMELGGLSTAKIKKEDIRKTGQVLLCNTGGARDMVFFKIHREEFCPPYEVMEVSFWVRDPSYPKQIPGSHLHANSGEIQLELPELKGGWKKIRFYTGAEEFSISQGLRDKQLLLFTSKFEVKCKGLYLPSPVFYEEEEESSDGQGNGSSEQNEEGSGEQEDSSSVGGSDSNGTESGTPAVAITNTGGGGASYLLILIAALAFLGRFGKKIILPVVVFFSPAALSTPYYLEGGLGFSNLKPERVEDGKRLAFKIEVGTFLDNEGKTSLGLYSHYLGKTEGLRYKHFGLNLKHRYSHKKKFQSYLGVGLNRFIVSGTSNIQERGDFSPLLIAGISRQFGEWEIGIEGNHFSSDSQAVYLTLGKKFGGKKENKKVLQPDPLPELPSVFFKKGSSELSPDGLRAVEEVYSLAQKYPSKGLYLHGTASSEGGFQTNLNLSRERAYEVKKVLRNLGYSGRIRIGFSGSFEPLLEYSGSKNNPVAHNRRVRVEFLD